MWDIPRSRSNNLERTRTTGTINEQTYQHVPKTISNPSINVEFS